MAGKPKDQRDSTIISEIVKVTNTDISNNDHNVKAALEGLQMLVGDRAAHWNSDGVDFAKKRSDAGLPTMIFDRLSGFVNQLVGDMRTNQPNCKLRAADDKATPELADMREGRIRAILAESLADRAFKEASKQIAESGWGNWRILTEYRDDLSFNQAIRIKPIPNQFAVVWDTMSYDYFRADAQHVTLLHKIIKDAYKRKYGKKQPSSVAIKDSGGLGGNWYKGEIYTIAEHFRREPGGDKMLYMLPYDLMDIPEQLINIWFEVQGEEGFEDGQIVDELPEKLKEAWVEYLKLGKAKQRKVKGHKIMRYLCSGHEMLEEPQRWISDKYFPIVNVLGKRTIVDGKSYYEAVIAKGKDAQKVHNIAWNATAETLGLAPKAAWVAPFEAIEGFETIWNQALTHPYSVLPYTHKDKEGAPIPPPQRPSPTQPSTANTQAIMMAIDEMRSAANMFDPTMLQGATADLSGVAVQKRVNRSALANYEFIDNFADSIRLTWIIIDDILGKVEDTHQKVTTKTVDGSTDTIEINEPNPEYEIDQTKSPLLNDMNQGSYEVTATVGPSYATQRMEAAEYMLQMSKMLPPPFNAMLADYVIKYQDYHGSQEAADRLRIGMVKQGLGYLFKPEELQRLMQQMAQSQMVLSQIPPPPPPPLVQAKMKQEQMKAIKAEMDAIKKYIELGQLKEEHFMNMVERVHNVGQEVLQREMAAMQGQQGQGQPATTGTATYG